MKKLMLLICLCMAAASCGLLQPLESQQAYLQYQFPDCRVVPMEEMALIYMVTDTVRCESYLVEMSAWKKNTIIKVEQ